MFPCSTTKHINISVLFICTGRHDTVSIVCVQIFKPDISGVMPTIYWDESIGARIENLFKGVSSLIVFLLYNKMYDIMLLKQLSPSTSVTVL